MVDTVKQDRDIYGFSRFFGRKILLYKLAHSLFARHGSNQALCGYTPDSRSMERGVLLSLLLCSLLLIL